MGQIAFTESMGRYSLPNQLDNIITWKVKNKETHQAQYHKQRKKQNQYIHRKTITNSLSAPSTHLNATHTSLPSLPLYSLIGMGWVWVWSWTVRVTIQFSSASSAVVDEIHKCIATFWVRFPIILLFPFTTTIPFSEPIPFAVFKQFTLLLLVVFSILEERWTR